MFASSNHPEWSHIWVGYFPRSVSNDSIFSKLLARWGIVSPIAGLVTMAQTNELRGFGFFWTNDREAVKDFKSLARKIREKEINFNFVRKTKEERIADRGEVGFSSNKAAERGFRAN